MSFLDVKEDVFQIELTRYGIDQLKKGKFDPAFYAFYDDDVLYNIAAGGSTEEQRETEPRILGTPLLKPQRHWMGAERASAPSGEILELEVGQYVGQLGSIGKMLSTASSTEIPRWSTKVIEGSIDTSLSLKYRQDGVLDQNDNPQIVLSDIEYLWINENDGFDLDVIPEERKFVFPDKSIIAIKDDYILVDIQELGVNFEDDNFEIEMFEIKEMYNEDYSKPLFFFKKPIIEKDGILLDQEDVIEYDRSNVMMDDKLVDHYLEILCDQEIPDDYICQYDLSLRTNDKSNIFIQDDGIINLGTQSRSCVEKTKTNMVSQYQIRTEDDLGDNC